MLISEKHAVVPAIEGQIGHEASGAVIHEYALLLVVITAFDHLKTNVLETCGLRNLPMDTRTTCRRHGCQINDEVANLAEEVVLIGIPVGPCIIVGVAVHDCDALERWCGFDRRKIDSISDKLGVVQLNQRLADEVGTRRKVDKGWSDR